MTLFSTMLDCSTAFIVILTISLAAAKLCWKLDIQTLSVMASGMKTDQNWPKVKLDNAKAPYNSSDHRLYVSHVDDHGKLPQRLSITFFDGDKRICSIGYFHPAGQYFSKSLSCIDPGEFYSTIVNATFRGDVTDCSGSILNLSKVQLVLITSVAAAVIVLLSVICCSIPRLRKYFKKQPALVDKPKEVVPPATEPPNIFIPQILSSSQSKKKTTSTSEHVDKRSIIPNPALTTTVSVYPKLSMQQPSTKASKVNQTKPEVPAMQEKKNDCNLQDIKPPIEEWKETTQSVTQTEPRSLIQSITMTNN